MGDVQLRRPSKKKLKYKQSSVKSKSSRDFPGGPVLKNTPSNAGDAGAIPGRRAKIPHAAGQPVWHSCWARAPQLESPHAADYRAHVPQLERENPHATAREKPVHRNGEPVRHNERPCVLQQRLNAAKKLKKKKE